MYTVFTPGGKDALGIGRGSQILAIFDTMGYGVVFDVDGAARFVREKRTYKECLITVEEASLARPIHAIPITFAGCPITRSEEFLRTIPRACPSFGLGMPSRESRYSRLCIW